MSKSHRWTTVWEDSHAVSVCRDCGVSFREGRKTSCPGPPAARPPSPKKAAEPQPAWNPELSARIAEDMKRMFGKEKNDER